MLRALVVAGAVLGGLGAGQAQAALDSPMSVSSAPARVAYYHKCAPGAHWQTYKVWRNGKKVRVGHCVLNTR